MEAYKLYLPTFDNKSPTTAITESSMFRRVLFQLIKNEDISDMSQQILPATNIFIMFNAIPANNEHNYIELRDFKLSKSCKKFTIIFKDATKFKVFQDFDSILSIEDSREETVKDEESTWYLSKISIKGFNDVWTTNLFDIKVYAYFSYKF